MNNVSDPIQYYGSTTTFTETFSKYEMLDPNANISQMECEPSSTNSTEDRVPAMIESANGLVQELFRVSANTISRTEHEALKSKFTRLELQEMVYIITVDFSLLFI